MKPNESQNNLKNWFIDWNKKERMSCIQRISRYFGITGQKSFRLKPINECPKNKMVFDCMSYFIFCPKHRNIAICDDIDSRRELAVGLPQIYLSPDYNKRMTAEDGICLILSDGDSRLFSKYKEQKPFDTNVSIVIVLHLMRVKCGFTRFICFTRLHSNNPEFQCCRKTSRIIWSNLEYLAKDLTDISGYPIRLMNCYEAFENWMNRIRINQEFYDMILPGFIARYSMKNEPEYQEQQILKLFNITKKQIELFFIDFIEHCFPSISMTFHSFKTYLKKYGFVWCEKNLRRMFYGFFYDSIQFTGVCLVEGELLIGLSFLDNDCPSYVCRLRFVFRFYDFDRDGYLSEEELREMVRDIDTNQSQEVIERIVLDNTLLNGSPKGMTFEEFYTRVEENWLEGTHGLCRFDFPLMKKIISDLEKNKEKSGFKENLNQYFQRSLNN